MKYIIPIAILFLACTTVFAEQDETVELTTYYPAPYGDYDTLKTTDFILTPASRPSPANEGQIYYDSGDDQIYYNTDASDTGWAPMQGSGVLNVLEVDKIASYDGSFGAPRASKKIGKDFKLVILTGQIWENFGGFIWKDGTTFKAIFHCIHTVVENTLTSNFSDTFIEASNNYNGNRYCAARVDTDGDVWIEQDAASMVVYAVIK